MITVGGLQHYLEKTYKTEAPVLCVFLGRTYAVASCQQEMMGFARYIDELCPPDPTILEKRSNNT